MLPTGWPLSQLLDPGRSRGNVMGVMSFFVNLFTALKPSHGLNGAPMKHFGVLGFALP